MKICVVIGTRPEIIKMASIIDEINKNNLELLLIHTGQHYDKEMSNNFFEDLKIPKPDYNLEVGSHSHGIQTGLMMEKLETIFIDEKPDIVLVQGDTNAVLAGSLVASKLHIPVGHIESGLRSYDNNMPEEINRKIADICSDMYFVPTEESGLNLIKENISKKNIFITGNTIVDACYRSLNIIQENYDNILCDDLKKINFDELDNILTLTIHRQETVDNKERLESIIDSLSALDKYNIIFPIHPRTKKNLTKFNLYDKLSNLKRVYLLSPLSYLNFLILLSKSKLILTDSGGIQEESIILNIPVLTLRYNTERPETVDAGGNILVGAEKDKIIEYSLKILNDESFVKKMKNAKNPYGDGTSSQKIITEIMNRYDKGLLKNNDTSNFIKNNEFSREFVKEDITIREYEIKNNVSIKVMIKKNNMIYPSQDKNLKDSMIVFEKKEVII